MPTKIIDKEFYTVPEIASLLDQSRSMIVTDIRNGRLVPEPEKIGKNYIISRDEVEKYFRLKISLRYRDKGKKPKKKPGPKPKKS